jgi:hypothetical protein
MAGRSPVTVTRVLDATGLPDGVWDGGAPSAEGEEAEVSGQEEGVEAVEGKWDGKGLTPAHSMSGSRAAAGSTVSESKGVPEEEEEGQRLQEGDDVVGGAEAARKEERRRLRRLTRRHRRRQRRANARPLDMSVIENKKPQPKRSVRRPAAGVCAHGYVLPPPRPLPHISHITPLPPPPSPCTHTHAPFLLTLRLDPPPPPTDSTMASHIAYVLDSGSESGGDDEVLLAVTGRPALGATSTLKGALGPGSHSSTTRPPPDAFEFSSDSEGEAGPAGSDETDSCSSFSDESVFDLEDRGSTGTAVFAHMLAIVKGDAPLARTAATTLPPVRDGRGGGGGGVGGTTRLLGGGGGATTRLLGAGGSSSSGGGGGGGPKPPRAGLTSRDCDAVVAAAGARPALVPTNRLGFDVALFRSSFAPAGRGRLRSGMAGQGWGSPLDADPVPARPRPNTTCTLLSSLGGVETRVAYVGPLRAILLEALVWVRVELTAWRELLEKV